MCVRYSHYPDTRKSATYATLSVKPCNPPLLCFCIWILFISFNPVITSILSKLIMTGGIVCPPRPHQLNQVFFFIGRLTLMDRTSAKKLSELWFSFPLLLTLIRTHFNTFRPFCGCLADWRLRIKVSSAHTHTHAETLSGFDPVTSSSTAGQLLLVTLSWQLTLSPGLRRRIYRHHSKAKWHSHTYTHIT